MTKVVINACHGGFGLSAEGRELASKLSGQSWEDKGNGWDHDRHDPVLVEVVETLGPRASGRFAELKVVEIDEDKYRVGEYDGLEWVETPNTIDWVTV